MTAEENVSSSSNDVNYPVSPRTLVPRDLDNNNNNDNIIKDVPFWNINVPASQHTSECPTFLQYALDNDKDRGILATPDYKHRRQSWDEVRSLVQHNQLYRFERRPSDLRTYKEYCADLAREHGTIMNFIMHERLHWDDLEYSGDKPFSNPNDYKILLNDWPYGIDERIVHLVVWVRFELPADPDSEIGDMTDEVRTMVNDYVERTFALRCGRENVLWFKNWNALKSIHAVEHFHVMLFDPDRAFVREMTGGDVALADKVKAARER